MKLGSGMCRLRIFDLRKESRKGLAHIRPIIVVVTDIENTKLSVKSCSGHIATCVSRDFNIDPHRMLWVEYYPEKTYGVGGTHIIPEKFESVEFEWQSDNAINPKWRILTPPMSDVIKGLLFSDFIQTE